MSATRPLLALLAASALLFAGCVQIDPNTDTGTERNNDRGSDPGRDNDQSGTQPHTGDEEYQINITAGSNEEYEYDPAEIRVPAGATVGVTLTNAGWVEHEIVIEAIGFHLHANPDETNQASFTAPEPGTYEFTCNLTEHTETGSLIVE